MKMHPFLRAYLAGIALPTMVVPLVVGAFALHHGTGGTSDLGRLLVFPVGLAPNAWGLWNMLYVGIRRSRELPIGPFGTALLLVLAPSAYGLQVALDRVVWTPEIVAVGLPLGLTAYYLAWKHGVARLNDLLGVG